MFQSPKNLPIVGDYVGDPYNSAKLVHIRPEGGGASVQIGEI